MNGTHCDQHDLFHRGCVGCLKAVRQYQAEQIRLDTEADHNQEQEQGQDIFASVFEETEEVDEEGDSEMVNNGFRIVPQDFDN